MKALERAPAGEFTVGDWRVRPALNRLEGADGEIRLEPRAMSVLVALARHAGEVVPRQRLLELVWQDVTVSDETVNRIVFDLRKVLGDAAQQPRYIETIRKVGYRLVAPVSEVPEVSETAPPSADLMSRWSRLRWLALLAAATAVAALFLSERRPAGGGAAPPRVRPLTAYAGFETHPAVSPDGRRLAFAWDGGTRGNTDLYWKPLDDGEPTRLTNHVDRDDNPAWAPDGTRIAFVRSRPGHCVLMLVEIPGGEERQLATCGDASISPLAFGADGRWLYFADKDSPDEPFRLQRLDLDEGRPSQLLRAEFGTLGDLYPAVAPDGRKLAFVRAAARSTISTYLTPAIGDVYLLDLVDGGEPVRLTHDHQLVAGLTWTAAGDAVVVASTREAIGYALWRFDVDDGTPSLLVNTTGLLRYPVRVGKRGYAYERWEGKTDIWDVTLTAHDPDSRESRTLQASTRSDLNPAIGPDGKWLAFTSARTGNYEIWVSDIDGSRPRQLTAYGTRRAESPAWSPDGTRLTFEVRGEAGSHIVSLELENGAETVLTDGDFEHRAPSFSVDGRQVYFGSNRSGSWQIWRVPATGGAPQRVTRQGGFRALESDHTDPPTLYVAKRHAADRSEGGIYALAEDGSEQRVAELSPAHWGNWTIVDGGLFVAQLEASVTLIFRSDLRDGTTRVAGRVDGWISREAPNLAITADGRRAVLARFTGLAADLYLVEP